MTTLPGSAYMFICTLFACLTLAGWLRSKGWYWDETTIKIGMDTALGVGARPVVAVPVVGVH